MPAQQRLGKPWLRATLALLAVHLGFVAIVQVRPGLLAVLLWYTVPTFLLVAAVSLLLFAFVRSWRFREAPSWQQLTGYTVLLAIVVSLAAFKVYPSSYDETPSGVPFQGTARRSRDRGMGRTDAVRELPCRYARPALGVRPPGDSQRRLVPGRLAPAARGLLHVRA